MSHFSDIDCQSNANGEKAMKAIRNLGRFLAGLFAALSAAAAIGQSDLPAAPKSLKAEETAIILVDFQANFVHPEGAWYGRFKPVYEKTRMLERTVELVKAARTKGVWVIHVTEGYSLDYRELDWTNPGAFQDRKSTRLN